MEKHLDTINNTISEYLSQLDNFEIELSVQEQKDLDDLNKLLQNRKQQENLSAEKSEKLIENYLFAEREPLRDEILELIEGEKPSLLQRKVVSERILKKILNFVETFMHGMN